ncbi:MAG: DUF1844 domain-containing protein [Candidatus Geothermarchaeales archaeon]
MAEKDEPENQQQISLESIDTYSLLGLFIQILSAQAWQHMGLRTAPGSGEIKKDFDQARVAVDAVAFLVEKLRAHISDDEGEELSSLLADLQINFARQTRKE